MKLIHGLICALTLSLSLNAAEPAAPAPADPTTAPIIEAPAPTAEIAPAENAPAEKKADAKAKTTSKKAKAKPASQKPDTHVEINPPENAVVKRENSNVRGRAGFIGEVITKLKKGEPVTLLEEITLSKTRKDEPARWYRIAMPAKTPVWVSAHFVDPATKLVQPRRLQVRTGPGENYSTVGMLQKGTAVKEIRQVDNWIEIETPADAYAFIAADLIDRSAPTVPTAPPAPEPAPEVVAVPPDVSNVPTPTEPAPPVSPEVVQPPVVEPPVVTPAPVEEPLPKRIVTREGIVRRSYNVQTPSYYELESPETKKPIGYLYSSEPDFSLKEYVGQTVTVTGEEYVDRRWPNTPVIEIESLEQQ